MKANEVIFQSTRPIRDGTLNASSEFVEDPISIHPPHTGRDAHIGPLRYGRNDISIHPPHTGRDEHDS